MFASHSTTEPLSDTLPKRDRFIREYLKSWTGYKVKTHCVNLSIDYHIYLPINSDTDFVEKGQTHLFGSMAKGFAGQIGGNAVEDDVATCGTRHYVTIATIEGYTRYFLFMVLMTGEHMKNIGVR